MLNEFSVKLFIYQTSDYFADVVSELATLLLACDSVELCVLVAELEEEEEELLGATLELELELDSLLELEEEDSDEELLLDDEDSDEELLLDELELDSLLLELNIELELYSTLEELLELERLELLDDAAGA